MRAALVFLLCVWASLAQAQIQIPGATQIPVESPEVPLVPKPPEPRETPSVADQVAAGQLPAVTDRLPKEPRVVNLSGMGLKPGLHGGTWRLLMGDQRDLRMMTIYSYARLVVFDQKLTLTPDILKSFESEGDRIFTLHLREGHKWSDGQPFTAEDFRYYWEDVANNPKLSPSGPNAALLINGKPPKFEVIDPLTVRYTWDQPNPAFMPALAAAQPLFIFMPFHYLKQFHPRYADKKTLDALVKAAHVKDWSALHERRSRQYRPENPELPTLDPWQNTTAPPAELYVFKRNPYFHRVDETGRQLPYINEVRMDLGTTSLIPAKAASGETNLQARYINFEDYTFLKQAEDINHFNVRLWERGEGAYAALMPNLNASDPVWRAVMRDVRVRRALSLGINRQDINRVIFFGLARESACSILPQSPLYKEEYSKAYANYDPATANRLLDEAGLGKRDAEGYRLLPDGRRMDIIVETAGTNTEDSDILELVNDDWSKLGIRAFNHPSQRDAFRQRILTGTSVMSLGPGLDNGSPTAAFQPDDIAPVSESQAQWPRWGLHTESGGHEGDNIDMPEAEQLYELYRDWRHTTNDSERTDIWGKMLTLFTDQVFVIGIVNGTQQPVVVAKTLQNVPDKALFAFEPGSFFGIYMPDTFWFDDKRS